MLELILSSNDYKEFKKDQQASNVFSLFICSGLLIAMAVMIFTASGANQLIEPVTAGIFSAAALLVSIWSIRADLSPLDVQGGTIVELGMEPTGFDDETEYYIVEADDGNKIKCLRCPTRELIIEGERVLIWKTEATKEANFLCPDPRLRETKTIMI